MTPRGRLRDCSTAARRAPAEQLIYNDISVKEIVEARIRSPIKASLTTHCLTAFPYQKALEAAAFHDQTTTTTKPEQLIDCYPLLGLVFSVKDCIHVKDFPTTLGCSSRAAQNETTTASLVQQMIDAGAIMIAKTTAPQLMMSNTTQSPLWGPLARLSSPPMTPIAKRKSFRWAEAPVAKQLWSGWVAARSAWVPTWAAPFVNLPVSTSCLATSSDPHPSANFTWSLPNDS